MKKLTTTLAVSATLISGAATADVNLFNVTEVLPASSYLQLAEAEMKCGANMKMDAPVKTPEKLADEKTDAKKAEEAKAATEANKKQ